jgi:hypothetical protein
VQAANTRDAWQRVACPYTPRSAQTVTHAIRVTTQANGDTLSIDGVQVEQKTIPTPYIQTDGGTAQRFEARVQAASSYLSLAQGWAAFRLAAGFASDVSTQGRNFFAWGDNANSRFYAYYPNGAGNDYFDVGFTADGSHFDEVPKSARNTVTLAPGTVSFVLVSWVVAGGSTTLKISVNGQPFDSASFPRAIASLATPAFDIGGAIGGTTAAQWDGSVLWAACGSGYTPTDADAVTLQALAAAGTLLPSSIQMGCTMVWPAASSAIGVPAFGRFSSSAYARVQGSVDGYVLVANLPYVPKTANELEEMQQLALNYPLLIQS